MDMSVAVIILEGCLCVTAYLYIREVRRKQRIINGPSGYAAWSRERIQGISEMLLKLAGTFQAACRKQEEDTEEEDGVCWKQRFLESRETIALQFGELGQIMEDTAQRIGGTEESTRKEEEAIEKALRGVHLVPECVLVLQHTDGRQEAYITTHAEKGRCITTKEIAERLADVTDRHWRPSYDSRSVISREMRTIKFEEETEYHLLHGIARAVKDEEAISGDNFTCTLLPRGRVLLCLSDGMGSGQRANRESEMVVELAEQLLAAGFSSEASVKFINSVMLLHSQEQHPTTLDFTMVDLYTGACEFVKLGAAPAYVKRMQGVEVIQDENLPVGMFGNLNPIALENNLEDGDIIVLVTDGVTDAFAQEGEESLEEFIRQYQGINPGKMAEAILKEAAGRQGGMKDDMTVLTAGIWKR